MPATGWRTPFSSHESASTSLATRLEQGLHVAVGQPATFVLDSGGAHDDGQGQADLRGQMFNTRHPAID